ncbi:MAG TPA: hypothetical protein VGG45_06115 [Terracidiphilus sp.]|jgi:hypothetical protein
MATGVDVRAGEDELAVAGGEDAASAPLGDVEGKAGGGCCGVAGAAEGGVAGGDPVTGLCARPGDGSEKIAATASGTISFKTRALADEAL